MRFLLDTHILLWATAYPERLSVESYELLNNPAHQLVFSIASIWEVAIKYNQKRPGFDVEPRTFRQALLEYDYEELPILAEHVLALDGLPPIHKDPFDRLLLAQAMAENMLLLTTDRKVMQYPGPIRSAT